jgi:hypothetical protein
VATHNLRISASKSAIYALCVASGLLGVHCGFGPEPVGGTGGQGNNPTSVTGGSSPTTGPTSVTGGSGGSSPTSVTGGAGNVAGATGTGGAGTVGGNGSTGGAPPDPGKGSYTVTGTWPERPIALATAPGTLVYTKVQIHDRFLAESCSIADYNKDGVPDVSAGRRWWAGPFGPGMAGTEHTFRGGHNDLPRAGLGPELVTGVSDDWSCFAQDVDGDGNTDIINIASASVDDTMTPARDPAPQKAGTAFWYKNPGPPMVDMPAAQWQPYQIHPDVRHEQHGLVDVNSDGFPEFYGACSGCDPAETKGYYQKGADPTAGWVYHAVTNRVEFPFGGTGWLHGLGFGDVNKDGKPDLITREGVWTNALAPTSDMGAFIDVHLWGNNDTAGQLGGSHMHAADMDGDGDNDIIAAELAHNYGVAWYEQTTPGTFVKHKITGSPQEAGVTGVVFSQPHALEVADMDGDGMKDVVTGKMRFAHPDGYGDPDLQGDPVNYVFQFKHATPPASGMVTITTKPIDTSNAKAGVGRQIAVGHINTDGIMDVCVSSKLGLFVYLGQ